MTSSRSEPGFCCWLCSRPASFSTSYDIVETATSATHRVEVPAKYAGAGGEFPHFDQIGGEWLAGPYDGLHVNDIFLLNWRTGRHLTGSRDPFGPRRYLDLSLPSLGRPLCSPLHRRALGDDGTYTTRPRYQPLVVRGQWVLDGTGDFPGQFRLERCGRHARRHFGMGNQATLGAGWLSWLTRRPTRQRGEVQAIRLRDQRTFWAALPRGSEFSSLAHTATALYASVPIGQLNDERGYRILTAKLPPGRLD